MSLCVICGGRHFESECPTEWMPVNPCKDCPRKPSNCGYPDEHCERKYIEQGKITVLRKLLEYIIEHPEVLAASNKIIFIDRLKSMLKQLEEGQ